MNKDCAFIKMSYIQNSKPFLRMGEKTQVVFPKHGRLETTTTRFSHSYEVMNSAMIIENSLQSPVEVDYQKALANVCLLHDLGHPAFGHEGQKILDAKIKKAGLKEGFSDNNNNFVVIEKNQLDLEPYDLASLIKYPEKLYPSQKKILIKMLDDSIEEDIKHFERKIKIYSRPKRTLTCEIMDEADRNSYVCSDLADCYSLGWADARELEELLHSNYFSSFKIKEFLILAISAIKENNKSLIKRTFNGLKNKLNQNFILGDNLKLELKDQELFLLREELYKIEEKIFINSKQVIEQRDIHSQMFASYIDHVLQDKFYPSKTYKNLIEKSSGDQQLRFIRDMIGETTDWYVQNYFTKNLKDKKK